MTPPNDLVAVIGHPEYAISPAGEVWRMTRKRPNESYPVPRPLAIVMKGRPASRSPHVRFDVGPGAQLTFSIAQLMRMHFPPPAPVRAVVYAPTMERA